MFAWGIWLLACDRSGVGIFSWGKSCWKTSHFCVVLWRKKILLTLLGDWSHFPSGDWNIFQPPVGAWLKKVMPLKLITLRGLELFWGQWTVTTYLCFWSKLFFVGVKQNTKFFSLKRNQLLECQSKMLKVVLKFLVFVFKFWDLSGSWRVFGVLGVFVFKTTEMYR